MTHLSSMVKHAPARRDGELAMTDLTLAKALAVIVDSISKTNNVSVRSLVGQGNDPSLPST